MNFRIQIDPITHLENQYKEMLEEGSAPYPTLADFEVKTPLELLEHYPIIPVLLTLWKLERQSDVTPFLKFQKPIANLPENEQKDLLRYITEIAVDFIPRRVNGNNSIPRSGALHNGTSLYQQGLASSLIEQLGLHFTERDIEACPKCGDKNCTPKFQPICLRCHHIISTCDKGYIDHYSGENTCNVCGEKHAECLEHVRTPGEKTCTVYPRKRSNPQEFCDIVSVDTRRLLQRLKRETREILKDIRFSFPTNERRFSFPTLVDFHTRHPEAFLQQYPILPAILTYQKVEKNPWMLLPLGLGTDQSPKKLVSAMRDITAVEWGDTLADTSITAFIKDFKLKISLDEIDTCPKCGEKTCVGDDAICGSLQGVDGEWTQGCAERYYGCETSHYTIQTCDNPLCKQPKYRQCTEHKCEIADHTGLVQYLFELENANILALNAQIFVKRINALTSAQQADFVKQFHTTVAQMAPIEKTAAVIQTTLLDHGLKITFENPEMK